MMEPKGYCSTAICPLTPLACADPQVVGRDGNETSKHGGSSGIQTRGAVEISSDEHRLAMARKMGADVALISLDQIVEGYINGW